MSLQESLFVLCDEIICHLLSFLTACELRYFSQTSMAYRAFVIANKMLRYDLPPEISYVYFQCLKGVLKTPKWIKINFTKEPWFTAEFSQRGASVNSIKLFDYDAYMQLKVGSSRCVDLSPLSLCKKIIFQDCVAITDKDISALGGQESLDLSGCTGITDVSHLGNVRYLFLSNCTGIKFGWGCLRNVSTLDVSHCYQLKDEHTASFSFIRHLNLSHCINITKVGHLKAVRFLRLNSCALITDVTSLGCQEKLDLSSCTGIKKGWDNLKYVAELNLQCCTQITNDDISSFGLIDRLNLLNCPLITDITHLKSVRFLQV